MLTIPDIVVSLSLLKPDLTPIIWKDYRPKKPVISSISAPKAKVVLAAMYMQSKQRVKICYTQMISESDNRL